MRLLFFMKLRGHLDKQISFEFNGCHRMEVTVMNYHRQGEDGAFKWSTIISFGWNVN